MGKSDVAKALIVGGANLEATDKVRFSLVIKIVLFVIQCYWLERFHSADFRG